MLKRSDNRPDTLREDVLTLSEKVHRLALETAEIVSDFKLIRREWSDAYDKILRADARFRARQQRAEENPNPGPDDPVDISPVDEVTARVLARRQHGVSGKQQG